MLRYLAGKGNPAAHGISEWHGGGTWVRLDERSILPVDAGGREVFNAEDCTSIRQGYCPGQAVGYLAARLFEAAPRRAVVTILDEDRAGQVDAGALLGEPALAADWNHPEEGAAWPHLRRPAVRNEAREGSTRAADLSP
ncbi:MAG: hypothetical protein IT529_14585 [Burkholderiales bacterium]|nr:hypothetical protein [Burkholderiales bacterium]